MKNRYCLFCGTLLPEDGVCLRCGAKYELADDGQMKVIPRKVKKVSVKPSVKKKTTAKKADPSQAETQTIPIPEDIFSFSDDIKREDKHTDWTGDSKGKAYEPNFVLYDEPSEQCAEPPARESVSVEKTVPTNYEHARGMFWAVFIGIALLVAGITFFVLHDRPADNTVSVLSSKTVQTGVADIANDFSENYSEPPDAISYFNNLSITDGNGNEKVRYEYDPDNKKLSIITITSDLSNDYYWLDLGLLPLISPEKRNNNLLIGSYVRHEEMGNMAISDDSLEILFALSDYIRSGAIEKLDYGGEDYSFEVDPSTHLLKSVIHEDSFSREDSFVQKSVLTYENNYLSRVRFNYDSDAYYERVLTYNPKGQLSQYRYKWYEKFKNEEESGSKLLKTEEAWIYNYLTDGLLNNAVGSLEEMTLHDDFVFNKNGQLMRMEEHVDSDDFTDHVTTHIFSYNEKGELTRLIKDTGEKELDPTANFEYAVPLSESSIPWRLAYQKHLSDLIKDRDILNYGQITDYKFAFIKRSESSVPELFVSNGMSFGSHICHFDGKNVITTQTNMDYYLENGMVIIEHGGGMDYYNTSVIGFDNNTWRILFEGEFHAMHDATGYFDSFKIDGEQVTREQYNKTLSSYMNPENLSMNMRELTYDRLLSYEECRDELASGSITYYSGNVIDRSEVLIPSSYDEWIEQRE